MNIVAVVGPTATGKSDLGVELSLALGGSAAQLSATRPNAGTPGAQIINADAYQLYRGMDIGTAKVTDTERRGVVHHQLDVLDVSEDSSVAAYQASARADLDAIAAAGDRAIVVGGSGLYVRALLDDMNFPGTDPQVRARIEERAERLGTRAMYNELKGADPAAAESIGTSNVRRMIRALEVIELTGDLYSANLPKQEYVRPALTIGLDYNRAALDARVEKRVDIMFERGLLDEVKGLAELGMGRTAARAVGYAEVLAHLAGDISLDEAREQIVTNTRRLTRKQMGWFGRDPRIVWLDGASSDVLGAALEAVERADHGVITPQPEGPVRRSLGS